MRKVYYIYNPQTQTYDRIYPTLRQRAMSYVRRLFIGMGLGAVCFIAPLIIFGSPSEKELRKENSRLEAQYRVLSRQMDEALGVLQDIQQRDDNLYRVIFMADPISPAIRQAGYGAARYEHLVDMADAELVVSTTQKMERDVALHPRHPARFQQRLEAYGFGLRQACRPHLRHGEVSRRHGLLGQHGH